MILETALMRTPLLALLLAAALPAQAEPVTLSLTDAQKEALIAGNTADDLASPTDSPRLIDRRPHGEVGVMVGTGGARGIYGVTSVPLGDKGWATFGFENSRNVWPGPY
ncbi:hypothetical protein FJQ54_05515 [Sandaracinobacter neustonicus]|uniref:Uncharacterized protein n=1 Tax=Sandaracinobacter neustonicus TaxID=1715348 RepID=A0A501XPT9_9SPHN|nr:hypothetical protein [Sandaracinobacter neustonicus]TPE62646.1 hypothetical protein FJQ54_05515 [Sandaracinobacter neustonicus]